MKFNNHHGFPKLIITFSFICVPELDEGFLYGEQLVLLFEYNCKSTGDSGKNECHID